MRITLGRLRQIIREAAHFPGQPVRNVLSPDINSREQIGSLAGSQPIDTVDDPDGLPEHLLEPKVTPEECFGPVPPNAEPPYVGQDPYVRDSSPNPTGAIKRG